MELSDTNIRKTLRCGRASLLMQINLPRVDSIQSFAAAERIVATYAQAADALENWATRVLLPKLEAELIATSRAQRLHYRPSVLQFSCKGRVISHRWLSVTTAVLLEGSESARHYDHRVWDLQKGVLCPIEAFLPRKEAARYLRWTFSLDDGVVWGIPRSAKKRGASAEPIHVRK